MFFISAASICASRSSSSLAAVDVWVYGDVFVNEIRLHRMAADDGILLIRLCTSDGMHTGRNTKHNSVQQLA